MGRASTEKIPKYLVHPIFILRFLSSLKIAYDANDVEERASLGLLHFFIRRPAAALLSDPLHLN